MNSLYGYRDLLLYTFLLLSLLIISTRAATFLHEVCGHALTALIFGREVKRVTISLFGGGAVDVELNSTALQIVVPFALSGIAVNLLTGILALLIQRSINPAKSVLNLFLSLFALTSIGGALGYLISGIYYNYGDPVSWSKSIPDWYYVLWPLFLTCLLPAGYFTLKNHVLIQERLFPTDHWLKRCRLTALTLGVAFVVYGVLFLTFNQKLVMLDASSVHIERAKARALAQKKSELFEKLKAEQPHLSEAQIQAVIQEAKIVLEKTDIVSKIPILPLMVAFFLIGGLWGVLKLPGKKQKNAYTPIRGKSVAVVLFLALIILMILKTFQ